MRGSSACPAGVISPTYCAKIELEKLCCIKLRQLDAYEAVCVPGIYTWLSALTAATP